MLEEIDLCWGNNQCWVFYGFQLKDQDKAQSVDCELCPLVLGELRLWSVKESESSLPWDSLE